MSVKSELLSPYLERTESLLERGKALKHINRTECLSLNLSRYSQVIHLIIMTLINITRRKLIVLWPKVVTPSVASACLYIYICMYDFLFQPVLTLFFFSPIYILAFLLSSTTHLTKPSTAVGYLLTKQIYGYPWPGEERQLKMIAPTR